MASAVYAVASGKGGVGKSLVTAGFSLCFAQHFAASGRRVVAVDLDFGCGNLNSCLGVRHPGNSINDFICRRVGRIDELLHPAPLDNLQMISCSYVGSELIELTQKDRRRLLSAIRALDAEAVFLDMGAGISADILDLFLDADHKVVVTTPESISLHNAYLFIKSAIFRALWKELEREPMLRPVRDYLYRMVHGNGVLTMEQIVERLKRWDRYSAFIVAGLVEELKFRLVLNMRRGDSEEKYLANFSNLVRKYLYLKGNVEYLGSIEYADGVRDSVQKLEPLLLDQPDSEASRGIRRIAEKLLAEWDETPVGN